jgi:hypothetical protein
MSIAANANPMSFSVRRSGRQIKPTTQIDFRSSERRRTFLLFRAINMSPLQGEEEIQFGPRESASSTVMRRPTCYRRRFCIDCPS